MNLGTLVNNVIGLKEEAKRLGLSMKKFGQMEIFERAGKRVVVSESIKLSIAKDENGKYLILKESYNTREDEIARTNRDTKFM